MKRLGRPRGRAAAGAAMAVALAWAVASSAAGRVPIRVSSEIRPDTVLIGQAITLRWRAFLPNGSTLRFPARPADDSTAHWALWEVTTLQVGKGGLREHRLSARLESFALGPVAMPGPMIRFRVPGEPARVGRFPTAVFVVGRTVSLDGPPPPLREMKALVRPPWWALVPWLWIIAALALLGIVVWAVRRWQAARRLSGPRAEVGPVTETPGVEARRRLAALVARGLPEAGRTLEHGTELADLLRRFVERQFESPRPGYTTSELASHLASRGGVSPEDLTLLRGILDACDLTKFARRPYDQSRAHEAEATAGRLIEVWAMPEVMPAEAGATVAAKGARR